MRERFAPMPASRRPERFYRASCGSSRGRMEMPRPPTPEPPAPLPRPEPRPDPIPEPPVPQPPIPREDRGLRTERGARLLLSP